MILKQSIKTPKQTLSSSLMLKVLHNHHCSKSRGLLEFLDERKVDYELINIVHEPLTVLELKTLLKKLNLSVQELIRKNETLFKERFSHQTFSDEDWLYLLSENPSLIQRPIVIKGHQAIVARPLEVVLPYIE